VILNGEVTSEIQFCLDDYLTLVCTLRANTYDWTIKTFSIMPYYGSVSIGGSQTVDNNFHITASGTGDERHSTLQVTLFERLAQRN